MHIKGCVLAGLAVALFSGQAQADSHVLVGGEIFHDTYKEYGIDEQLGTDPRVRENTDYGSVTATYEHEYNDFFTAIDGRYSWGKADYKSASGVLDGIPDRETDLRLRTGIEMVVWYGKLMPYIGAGWRYYFDQGKGLATDTGAVAYDRHISQIYIPIGATYKFTSGSWTFAPNIEVDPMVWGQVSSHLGTATAGFPPAYQVPNITNNQHSGIGFRSEFMVGQEYKYFKWEFGPFIRYWNIPQSNLVSTPQSPPGTGLGEPKNTRIQAGLGLRVGF